MTDVDNSILGDTTANSLLVLESKLRSCIQELEDTRDRLSDRELEVEILQKRLSLRKSNSITSTNECPDCARKEVAISDLNEKMAQLELTVEEICSE